MSYQEMSNTKVFIFRTTLANSLKYQTNDHRKAEKEHQLRYFKWDPLYIFYNIKSPILPDFRNIF